MPKRNARASFIEPMLLRTEKLPEGPEWLIELKLDGYRALPQAAAGNAAPRVSRAGRADRPASAVEESY